MSSEDAEIILLDSSSDEEDFEIKDEVQETKVNAKEPPEVITLEDSEPEEENPAINPNETRTKLFVNYLPQDLTDEEFNNLFLQIGPISESLVFREKITNYSYGYGVVNFECPEDAARAIRDLNDFQIRDGKKLKVVYSRQYNGGYSNLFFQDAGEGITEAEMRQIFGHYGEIVQFKLLLGPDRVTLGRGFVRFANRFQAVMAIKGLNGQKVMKNGEYLCVRFAEEHGKQKAPIYYNIVKKAMRFPNKRVKARLGTKYHRPRF